MEEDDGVVLSVRGEAAQSVAPDFVVLAGSVVVRGDSKRAAVAASAAALDRLTAELSGLGGVARRLDTERSPLVWSAFSAATHAEGEHDKETGRYELTGHYLATVEVAVAARDFDLLDALGSVIADHDEFNVRQVSWGVDDDNPAWSAVRSEAIQAAVRKGRDYAAALGVSLLRVEHVADTGLLGGSGESPGSRRKMSGLFAARASFGGDEVDTPSLDPVPQQLTAVIEARFRTTPAALTA